MFSGTWLVRDEPDAPSGEHALCQTETTTYAAIQLDQGNHGDVTAITDFKPISGTEDQAGGILFRIEDADNYYIVRANALENNVAFYIYRDGKRSQLGPDGNIPVEAGKWHELRVDAKGNTFTAFLDGKEVLDTEDTAFEAGGIGLWTKADSVTCFDRVTITDAAAAP